MEEKNSNEDPSKDQKPPENEPPSQPKDQTSPQSESPSQGQKSPPPKENQKPNEEVLKEQNVQPEKGLTEQEAGERLKKFGENALEEKKKSMWLVLFSYFWGPIPWMIEIAAILSGILERWPDFIVIAALLLINAALGFFHEFQAGNAIEALKNQLALKAKVLRDGTWKNDLDAKLLVPGDIISVKLGNVIPADIQLLSGDYLTVDQSALTGESLPVNKKSGDVAYSGTIVKQGEMTAVVTATAMNTFFGKTAKLVQEAKSTSHFQQAVVNIGKFLIITTLLIVAVIMVVDLFRLQHFDERSLGHIAIFLLVLVVAGIPVALPAVMSVTMAIGAREMARMKAIVCKLMSIEELAGMNVLCSDKTGTLTKNILTVGDIQTFGESKPEDVLFIGALACQLDTEDSIDKAITSKLNKDDELKSYTIEKYIPFDPVSKKAEAIVSKGGEKFHVTKGAPQVIFDLAKIDEETKKKANQAVLDLAGRGFRTLGIAKGDDSGSWTFLGMIPLFDPPRDDTKQMIEETKEMDVRVKMVTGDHVAIAKEIAKTLGLGDHILEVDQVFAEHIPEDQQAEMFENADGFAQVFPEHKFQIVKHLQSKKHIVGMTGDGVNDAPALKQADIGIAVSGATDAARAAADIVLTEEGISVITKAIEEARRIFGRLKSYAMYRISETVRLLLFLLLAMLVFSEHPLTAIMIILIALLNDIPIMMIAYDHMEIQEKPVTWNMREVITVAVGLAVVGVISTFGLFWIGDRIWNFGYDQCSTLSFMAILCGGNLTIYLTRNREYFLSKPLPEWKFFAATLFSQVIGTLAAVYGLGTEDFVGIGWKYVGYSWIYIAIWFFICMLTKVVIYHFLERNSEQDHPFVDKTKGKINQ